jgi:hypothetical protein
MSEPIYFVVERTALGEQPALYYDQMPIRLTGKNAKRDGLIYAVRVDILPHAAQWLAMTLPELYAAFQKARAGKIALPQNIAPPPRATEAAKPLVGHRERFRKHPGSHLPAEPFPTIEDLDRRAPMRLVPGMP